MKASSIVPALLAACTGASNPPPPCGTPGLSDQLAQTQNEILSLTLAGGSVYWMDMGGVGTVTTDGTGATEIVQQTSGAAFALGGFVTTHAANVYWADGNFPAGSVDSVPMQGGSSTQITATDEPVGVAVDDHNIYWSTFGSSSNPVGTITEQPLAGGAAVVLASGLSTVGAIGIDDTNVYWSDVFGAVSLVPIAGGAVRTLAPASYQLPPNTILDESPVGIAVAAGRVYWTSTPLAGTAPSEIKSVATDGGAVTVVATLATRPTGLAVDGDFVYWAEIGPVTSGGGLGAPPITDQGTINRIASDGSGTLQVLATGATYPVGPVVDDNAIYYSTGGSLSTLYRVVM